MLYPYQFNPILKSTIWGGEKICAFKNITPGQQGIGESWEVSAVAGDISVVSEGADAGKSLETLIGEYGEALLGKKVAARFGAKFPLLIKFIDACDDLSIQVHPDDELSQKRHGKFGKTEMWYVIGAESGTILYSGFSQQINPEEYVKRVENNTICDVLLKHPIQPGDVFFLPAGRVHAIGSGSFIAEIQQTSDVTYRIYDFDRRDAAGNSRELHTELAKDAIDYRLYDDYKTDYTPQADAPVKLATCQYFETNLLDLTQPCQRSMREKDSFVIYICMDGKATLTDINGSTVELTQGTTVLVPATCADVTIEPHGSVKLMETYLP